MLAATDMIIGFTDFEVSLPLRFHSTRVESWHWVTVSEDTCVSSWHWVTVFSIRVTCTNELKLVNIGMQDVSCLLEPSRFVEK